MQDFRKRRSNKGDVLRAGLGVLGVVALMAVAYFAVRGTWTMYGRFTAASGADAAARVELEELKRQYEQIGASAQALSSERGVEAGVRERYGVAKPGEGQIDIVRRVATSSAESQGGPNIFVKIFRALFVW